jgi:hypothetical protein
MSSNFSDSSTASVVQQSDQQHVATSTTAEDKFFTILLCLVIWCLVFLISRQHKEYISRYICDMIRCIASIIMISYVWGIGQLNYPVQDIVVTWQMIAAASIIFWYAIIDFVIVYRDKDTAITSISSTNQLFMLFRRLMVMMVCVTFFITDLYASTLKALLLYEGAYFIKSYRASKLHEDSQQWCVCKRRLFKLLFISASFVGLVLFGLALQQEYYLNPPEWSMFTFGLFMAFLAMDFLRNLYHCFRGTDCDLDIITSSSTIINNHNNNNNDDIPKGHVSTIDKLRKLHALREINASNVITEPNFPDVEYSGGSDAVYTTKPHYEGLHEAVSTLKTSNPFDEENVDNMDSINIEINHEQENILREEN